MSEEQERIADKLVAEVLAANVVGTNKVAVSIRLEGAFKVPGTRVEVEGLVIVATVPAKVMPA